MTTAEYNMSEVEAYNIVRDRKKYFLGIDLGRDPEQSNADMMLLEILMANWLLDEGGGIWLANHRHKSDNTETN